MTSGSSHPDIVVRPLQYRDLERVESLLNQAADKEDNGQAAGYQIEQLRQWYAPLKLLSLFPSRWQHWFRLYVAEQNGESLGVIQVSPFNAAHSTWHIDRVAVAAGASSLETGSHLLSYCLKKIVEARFWLLEVNVNHKDAIGLYRQNGFQPLAQMTYWAVPPAQLQELAARDLTLPNLLPIGNADAALLYQLDTAAMPPLVRQVFDRELQDFKQGLISSLVSGVQGWFRNATTASGYVFELQRKAAIGYFQVQFSTDGSQPHRAQLTVHPAYTWLYPELLTQMARLSQGFPPQALQLASADYQPEREEYLEQLGAERIEHTLMMSRSVWHKLRESRQFSLESLQLSEVLQGLQPSRKPVPGRISLLPSLPRRPDPLIRRQTRSQWSAPEAGSPNSDARSDQEYC